MLSIDPVTLQAILTALNQLKTEEGRQKTIMAVIIPIVFLVVVLVSPIAIFFAVVNIGGQDKTLIEVVHEIDAEMTGRVHAEGEGADEVILEVERDGVALTANWPDVLAVFAVRTNMDLADPSDVARLTEKHIKILKETYNDMNEVKSTKTEEKYIDDNGDEQIKTSVSVNVESHGWQDMMDFYHFSPKQREMLENMMKPEYYELYMQLLGMTPSPFDNMTVEEMNVVISNLPAGQKTTQVVELALSKLGTPYSQAKRNQAGYFDCSSFVHWVYSQLGLNISYGGSDTAAAQAQWCVENNLVVSASDLQAGDLVFFSSGSNGRFMNIDHIGIYAGDGMIVDASSSKGKVVYRKLWTSTLVLCARPSLKL